MDEIKFSKETDFKEIPMGKIPRDWEIVRLDEALRLLRNGLTLAQNKEKNGYPVSRIETISEERIDPSKVGYVPDLTPEDLDEYKMVDEDILFSHINSLEHIGKTAIYEETPKLLIHGMNLLLLRPDKEKVYPKFLLYLLRLYRTRNIFRAMAKKAVNQASINQTELGRVKIFLPPMDEQRAIVDVLGVVDLAIARTGEVVAKTERLKKGLMQQLLTHGIGHTEYKQTPIGKIPKTWGVMKIEDIAETSSGGTPNRSKKEYYGGNIPWVKSGELKDNTIYDTEEKITENGLKNSSAKLFPRGTLLVAMYGATVGKTGILGMDATTNQAICAILPKNNTLNLTFLQYYIIFARNRWISQSSGGAQPNISQEIIRSSRITLPKFEEQEKIAEILSTLDKKLALEKNEKTRLERIKEGLMDLLLTGKVRVKVD